MNRSILNLLKSDGAIAALCVAAAATILRLAHPPFGFAPAAFLAWPLLFEACRRSRRPVLHGLAFGALYSMMIASWLMETLLVHYGRGILFSTAFFIGAAGLIPSLVYGLFDASMRGIVRRTGEGRDSLTQIVLAGLQVAAAFTACEWLRKSFSPEHGWGEVAASFASMPEFWGIAPITGAGGVAFATVFCGFLVWVGIIALIHREKKNGVILLVLAICIAGTMYLSGIARRSLLSGDNIATTMRVAVIHPGIDQSQRWRSDRIDATLSLYRRMSLEAFSPADGNSGLRLLVWPETAVTAPLEANQAFREFVRDIAQRTCSWILLGAPSFRDNAGKRCYYNSVYLIDPAGNITGRYDKIHLLPFAERRYAWMELLAEYDSPLYESGEAAVPLVVHPGNGIPDIPAGAIICYEAGIPSLAGAYARRGARLIANISNDAWFGESSESLQQVTLLQLRCAELGIPAVRSSGYGTAAVIDRLGRVTGITGISGEAILRATIDLSTGGTTLYARFQHWFEMACALFLLVAFLRRC